MTYNPETYWSHVAQEIQKRTRDNVIAGDDNPYFDSHRSVHATSKIPDEPKSRHSWRPA